MASKENHKFSDSMPNPRSVFVPFEALTKRLLKSVISVACEKGDRYIVEGSERPLLCFLLAINEKLTKLKHEGKFESNAHAQEVEKWLFDRQGHPVDWKKLDEEFHENYKATGEDRYKTRDKRELYYEMGLLSSLPQCKKSLKYMEQYRPNGFKPEELKIYWNYEQIEQLCQKTDGPYDPSNKDVIENLHQYPVEKRAHSGKISYKTIGIEKVVFDVPESAQIILLNFANEESPGGGYLRHAIAQEEVLLYNADGYRALLDLKYGRMGGGYAIPEFGLAYVRDMRVVDPNSQQARKADMLVSACYCLDHQQLYENPRDYKEWYQNNLDKFRAFIAAAVANTNGDGSNTYLLLGPIGTGAFGNDTTEIAKVFRDVLNKPLLGMEYAVRYAFENIWFVSIDEWKNDEFKAVFDEAEIPTQQKEKKSKKEPKSEAQAKVEPAAPAEADVKAQVKPEGEPEPEEKTKESPSPTTEAKGEPETQPTPQVEKETHTAEGASSDPKQADKAEPTEEIKP